MANLLSTTVNGQLNTGNVIDLGYTVDGSIATTEFRGINFYSFSDLNYYIGKPAGAWTQPLDIHFYTGIRLKSHSGYGGTKFINLNGGSTLMSVGDGGNNINVYTKITSSISSGTVLSHGSMDDAIGWNSNYGTYIGSTVGGTSYLYANGTLYTGGVHRTLIHSGNIGSQSVSYADESGYSSSSGSVEWTSVQNKPATFPPSAHNHDDRYYTESESDGRFLIGTTNPGTPGNFTLSIGNNGTYSYVQSHSSQPLRLNPLGNALEGPSGSTIWHSGNDGSGSGLDADLLDGQQGSYYQPSSTAITTSNWSSYAAPRAYITESYVEFTIEGDANTYYPVTIHNWNGTFSWQRYSIHRGYSDTAPWDPIGTGVHRGGLTFAFEWAGDIAWGGNDKSIRVIEFNETYTTMVAGMQLAHCEGVVVWLRGGGAYYRLHGPGGRSQSYTINMSTWTSCAGVQYEPRSYDGGRVNSEINSRYPIRGNGNGDIFVSNQAVIHSGNIGSQSVASAGNATTVGGLAVHTGRNNEANKIVRTQENGYVFFGYINSSNGNENNNSNPDRVWGTNGSDDYLRTYRTSALSVGYAASAGNADTLDSLDSSEFARGRAAYQVLNLDTAKQPGLYQYDGGIGGTQPAGTNWYNVKTIEIGSEYRYSQFVMPYSENRIFYRYKVDAGWQPYVELITSGNIASQSVNYADESGYSASSGSVEWTNVNSRPTALSQFTNNLGNYGGWYSASGGTVSGTITLPQNPVGTTYGNGVAATPPYMLYQGAGNDDGIRFYSESDASNRARMVFEIIDDIEEAYSDQWVFRNKRTYSDYLARNEFQVSGDGNAQARSSMRAPIFYDSNDTGYYLDPNGTSNLLQLNTSTRARWNMPRWWNDRSSFTSDENYWTGTNGWGTGQGTWANAWKGGFSGWDIWGTGTDHPQGGGYIHAQGIVSGQHYASSSGGDAYGWMMVGAANATDNRYWLRGKWSTSTSGWTEMMTSNNNPIAWNMDQYVRTSDSVSFNSTTSPTFLVNNQSDNTKGYRIYNTSNASVSAMFTNSANALVIGAGAFDQVQLNKKVLVSGAALGVNVAASATAGRIDASNDIVAYSSSDERLKHNITPIENALDKVKSLTGVEFDWKPEYKHAHGYEGHDTGIIAQQVQEVIPSAVRTNDTGFLAVRYEKLIGLLVEGMKEQQAQIDELKAKLDGIAR
jgi:hypothetical protein